MTAVMLVICVLIGLIVFGSAGAVVLFGDSDAAEEHMSKVAGRIESSSLKNYKNNVSDANPVNSAIISDADRSGIYRIAGNFGVSSFVSRFSITAGLTDNVDNDVAIASDTITGGTVSNNPEISGTIVSNPAVNSTGTASNSATAAATAFPKPFNDRQAILCMGEEDGTMFISWKGDKDGPRLLRYAKDKYSLPVSVPVRAQRTKILSGGYYRYKVELTGLEPGGTYYYEIGDGMMYDTPRIFDVPDNDGDDVFVYFGDPQVERNISDYEGWGKMLADMYEKNPEIEFAVVGGDMVNVPTRLDHWNAFLDNCGIFSMIPMAAIPGNHEGVTANNTYKKLFRHIDNGPDGEAFYYFDHGKCRFLMLDSSFLTAARQVSMGQALWSAKEREVESWLRRALSESTARWNIVVVHHPVYGVHDMFTVSKEIREYWLPIMKEGGVDLVLCGHQHVYMRTRQMDGIVHVMGVSGGKRSRYYKGFNEPVYSKSIYSSGANYQIIRATENELEITSYSEKGGIIDAARIEKNTNFPYFRTFW